MTDSSYFQVTTSSRREGVSTPRQPDFNPLSARRRRARRASLPHVMASLPGLGRFGMVAHHHSERPTMTPAADSLSPPLRTDVLIVGAGPVGLFAAFEAG